MRSKSYGLAYWLIVFGTYRFGELAGLSNPALGIQDLPAARFFSMHPGDTIEVLHYLWDNWSNNLEESLTQYRYLQWVVSPNGDTISLKIQSQMILRDISYGLTHISPIDTTGVIYPLTIGVCSWQNRDLGEIRMPYLDKSD